MIAHKDITGVIKYDPLSGAAYRIKPRRNSLAFGCLDASTGYIKCHLKGKPYYLHRLIFLYMTGILPGESEQVDHIDHDKKNNRWENLRIVTNAENGQNKKMLARNTSGIMGVCWSKERMKWQAAIKVNGKRKFLGRFDDINDAALARKNAEIKYGFHRNHGK